MGKTLKDKFKPYRESTQYNKLKKIKGRRDKKIRKIDIIFSEDYYDNDSYIYEK